MQTAPRPVLAPRVSTGQRTPEHSSTKGTTGWVGGSALQAGALCAQCLGQEAHHGIPGHLSRFPGIVLLLWAPCDSLNVTHEGQRHRGTVGYDCGARGSRAGEGRMGEGVNGWVGGAPSECHPGRRALAASGGTGQRYREKDQRPDFMRTDFLQLGGHESRLPLAPRLNPIGL